MNEAVSAGGPDLSSTASETPRWPGWTALRHTGLARVLGVFFVMLLCSAPIVAFDVNREHSVGGVDEGSYLDYVAKVGAGHFVVGQGEKMGQVALHAVACRGLAGIFPPVPAGCKAQVSGLHGRNSADIDPPTYYLATAVLARGIRGLGISSDFVTSSRLTGALWAAFGLTALFFLLKAVGASPAARWITSLIPLAASSLRVNWTYVTPHALDLAIGALSALLLLRWRQGLARSWSLFFIGLVPPLVKATDVLIALVIILLLLLTAAWPDRGDPDPRGRRRRDMWGAGIVLSGLVFSSVLWLVVRRHYELTTRNAYPEFDTHHFPLSHLTSQIGAFFSDLDSTGHGYGSALSFWIYGAVFAAIIFVNGDRFYQRLAVATAAGGLFGAWVFVLSNFYISGQYIGLTPARYGFALLPLVFVFAAKVLTTRVHYVLAGGLVLLLLTSLTTTAFP